MKNIDSLFQNDYQGSSDPMIYENKSELYALYESKKRHNPNIQTIIIRRIISTATCLLLFISGTTAFALTNPNAVSALNDFVRSKLSRLNISEKNVNDIAERLENFNVETTDAAISLNNIETNKYGETIGGTMFETDLIKVGNSGDPEDPTGYVYRYDLGVIHNNLLLPEERAALQESGLLAALRSPDLNSDNSIRDWVYAFDKDGINIIGKYIFGPIGFRTNEQLEDPETSKYFCAISEYNKYNEYVQDRINYKLENGEAPEIAKLSKPLDLPTENLDRRTVFNFFTLNGTDDIPLLSDDAVAYSEDESFCVIDELITTGQATDRPKSRVYVRCFKVGSGIITIKDGDNEYQYECTLAVGKKGYETYERRIK